MSCLFGDSEIGSVIYYTNGQKIEISKIVDSEGEIWSGGSIVYDGLKFTALEDDSSVILTKYRRWTPTNPITIKYSLNGKKWTQYTLGDEIKLEKAGNYVYLCAGDGGNSTFSEDSRGSYYYFQMTGRISASGNIMSMLDNSLQLNALTYSCFTNLFQSCGSLITPPSLPAVELASSCYSGMFYLCTNLTSMPELPAETLYNMCYCQMFQNCPSLAASPILRAKNLAANCYYNMFLNSGNVTSVWMPKIKSYDSNTYGTLSRSHTITINCEQDGLRFTAAEDDCTTRLSVSGNAQDDQLINLEYSINSEKWHEYSFDENGNGLSLSLPSSGDYALFRAKSSGNETFSTSSSTYTFHTSGGQYLNGSIQYLLSQNASRTDAPEYCYNNLFNGCSGLSGEISLDSREIGNYCYSGMFDGTGVTKAYVMNICESDYDKYRCGELPQNTQYKYSGLSFSSESSNAAVALNKTVASSNNVKLDYSIDNGATWNTYTWNGTNGAVISIPSGGELMFAATSSNNTIGDGTNYYTFSLTGNIDADGDILSLLSKDINIGTAPSNCFNSMFYNCSTLLSMPPLRAKVVGDSAYAGMFINCTSLSGVKDIEAKTINGGGCYNMFRGCTSLTDSPLIHAINLDIGALDRMFYGCSSLSSISVRFDKWGTSNLNLYADEWVYGVAEDGIFTCPKSLGDESSISRGISYCPQNWNVVESTNYLTFVSESTSSTVTYKRSGSYGLEYSKNGGEWTEYVSNTPILLENFNDTVRFRGNCTNNCGRFYINGPVKAKGSVTSLNDGAGGDASITLPELSHINLFKDCTSLLTAPELPAKTVPTYGYAYMFSGCTGLIDASTIPATGIGERGCDSMFYGCTSLKSSPMIMASNVGEYGCSQMFNGCTSIVNASELMGTTISDYGYQSMFNGCTSLKIPPTIRMTTANQYSCYQMFNSCTSLLNSPELNANTVGDYGYYMMFAKCSSLSSIGTIRATTISKNGCEYMFSECTALSTVPVLSATSLNYCAYGHMFNNCKNIRYVADLPNSTFNSTGSQYSYMFNGCESLTATPNLNTTSLVQYCYNAMFNECKNLTVVKELKATKLANYCYMSMFNGCTSLDSIPKLPAKSLSNYTYCYSSMLNKTAVSSVTLPTGCGYTEYRNGAFAKDHTVTVVYET